MKQSMQVLTSTETVNWYTPSKYIEMARQVMGSIDLDPASCDVAQSWIKADFYYCGKVYNGLDMPYYKNVWLNPPFDNTALWCTKLYNEIAKGNVDQAIILVNSNHGYKWYEELWRKFPVCCARERIEFLTDVNEDEIKWGTAKSVQIGDHRLMTKGQAKRGQTFAYYGNNIEAFYNVFSPIGRVIVPKKANNV